jgi:magnesium transporter
MIYILKYNPAEGLSHDDRIVPELLTLGPGELLWVDLEDPTAEEAEVLKDYFQFHPLAVEDTLVEIQYPKLDIYPDYVFLVLHGINYMRDTEQFTTAEIDVFLGRHFLITHHDHRMRSVRDTRQRILQEPQLMTLGLDVIIQGMLDKVVDHYFPELEKLEDRIEEVEEEIFSPRIARETLNKILGLKRDLMHLKRIVFPQREVFNRLSRDEIHVIRPSTRVYFRDTYDSLFRIHDIADNYRDLLTGFLDIYMSSISNSLNETMKLLTVISTICIPMTVVAGIYGMNFRFMPELDWKYGYYFSLGLMLAIGIAMFLFFRRKHWI